ncbi:MAG: transcriptional regulator [Deltaproteobacteria bacterium]|nr:transcriptional regulator [Deltaproteobacteria bacterium]
MTLPRRWFAIGDPQTTLEKVQAVLGHHRLLGGDGQLLPDVGLVSMGDHFDFGGTADIDRAERRAAGLQGCRVLQWLTGHPQEQVRVLVGNHDLVRVQEFARIDDGTFAGAQDAAAALSRLRGDERTEAEAAFRAVFPSIPTAGLASRDFSTFIEAQRVLVQRLLVEDRLDCAVSAHLNGKPCLLTHTGVTLRELSGLGLAEERSPEVLARRINAWFRDRVAKVADAWSHGVQVALDLEPIHVPGQAPLEAGGWFAARPANPDRPGIGDRAWEWAQDRPRRFDPRTLPGELLQVVGHTRHTRLVKELAPWANSDPAGASPHTLSSLTVDGGAVSYERGVAPMNPGAAVMVFTDIGLHEAPVEEAVLLELDGVGERYAETTLARQRPTPP